ncbi:hypothetical protein EJ08DRAFT_714282 [Tothia fuscella]|uniref:Metalloendopeptidase n=1 Tax=Tothia fuscella TaxID=1048955 RepID=A0A9P4NST5_9PEZI|nr:hypothetical protein EJ08DRAFT_714282 [Tothia fuscella]
MVDPRVGAQHFSWAWNKYSDYCPAFIEICYWDQTALDKIEWVLLPAIDIWHDSLGPNRGVQFIIDPEKLCDQDNPHGIRRVAIHWSTSTANLANVRIGFLPYFKTMGLHWTEEANDHSLAIPMMVHELGHVLGLFHEHQRTDARQYTEIYCWNLGGAAQAWAIFMEYPLEDEGGRMPNIEDAEKYLCNDFKVASDGRWDDLWTAPQTEANLVLTGKNGRTWYWTAQKGPSRGDIRAVKRLYPDVLPPPGSEQNSDAPEPTTLLTTAKGPTATNSIEAGLVGNFQGPNRS